MKKLIIVSILLVTTNVFAVRIPMELQGYWYWHKYATEDDKRIRRADDRRVHELYYVKAGSLKYTEGPEYRIKRVHLRTDTWFQRSYDLYFYDLEGYISVTLIKTAGSWSTIRRIDGREIMFYAIRIRKQEFTEL